MGGRGSSYSKELSQRASGITKILEDAGLPVKKSQEEIEEILRQTDKKTGYKDISQMTEKEMKKEMNQLEKSILKKYNSKQLDTMRERYSEAMDLYASGSEVEDKKGLATAQKKYYDRADSLMSKLPSDYKRLRELDNELW